MSTLGCAPLRSNGTAHAAQHDQLEFNKQAVDVKCSETLRLITDLEMLAQADYFVGSHKSNIALLVDVLRYAVHRRPRSTYVEATPSRPVYDRDWYAQIRRMFPERFPWEGAIMAAEEKPGT